jgi:hypothetical protein
MKENFIVAQRRRRSRVLGAAGALLALSGAGWLSTHVRAHEAPCPYCDVDLAQDTPDQDNETVLKAGKKRIEYRCVFCALSEASSEYKGDLTILAPSETVGSPVVLTREGGKWTSDPETAVFAAQKASHKVCHITYRAFTRRAAFDAWVKKHPDNFDKDAKPLMLAQMIEVTQEKN